MKRQLLIEIICGLLILLFAYTAISKLMHFDLFRHNIILSPLIGRFYKVITWGVPVTELVVVVMLLIPRYRMTGLVGSLFLLVLFTMYMGYLLLFRPGNLPCSCGGVLRQLNYSSHLLFNIGFIVLNITGILMCIHSKILSRQTGSKLKTWAKSKHPFSHF